METMRQVRRDASKRAKLNTPLQTTVQVNEVCGVAAYNITLSRGVGNYDILEEHTELQGCRATGRYNRLAYRSCEA